MKKGTTSNRRLLWLLCFVIGVVQLQAQEFMTTSNTETDNLGSSQIIVPITEGVYDIDMSGQAQSTDLDLFTVVLYLEIRNSFNN